MLRPGVSTRINRLLTRRRDELSLQRGRLQRDLRAGGAARRTGTSQRRLDGGCAAGLRSSTQPKRGPFDAVVGLVADVFEVPMQWAPLVDAALGPIAQHVVLRDNRVLEQLEAGTFRPAGRVGFLSVQDVRPGTTPKADALAEGVGVLGRLDELVQAADERTAAGAAAVGRTWAVEMLSACPPTASSRF